MLPLKKLLLFTVLSLALLGLSPSVARADVITFDDLERIGAGFFPMNSYTHGSFTFTSINNPAASDAFYTAEMSNPTSYAGSAGLFLGHIGDNARLSAAGTPFSLTSIDMSRLHDYETGPVTVTFTGFLVGGGTVIQSFTFSQFGFQTFTFDPSFTNLAYVEFGPQNHAFFQIDNVVLNQSSQTPIPEPMTLVLLGTGLAGVACKVRKRFK